MDDDAIQSVLVAAKAHPARRLARRYLWLAAALGAAAVLTAVLGQPWAAPLAGFALVFALIGYDTLRWLAPRALINAAYADLVIGAHHSARRLLAALPARLPRSGRRLLSYHEAVIAIQMGDARGAVDLLSRAMDAPPRFRARIAERAIIEHARGLRALARASIGEHAAALEDARQVRESKFANSDAVGRAELARAVVAASENRLADLQEALARGAPYWNGLDAKERALARALGRVAVSPPSTVYRTPASGEDHASPVAAWLEPRASMVRDGPATNAPVASASSPAVRTFVAWAVLVAAFAAIWKMLNPAKPGPPPPVNGPPAGWVLFVVLTLMFILFVLRGTRGIATAWRRRVQVLQTEIRLLGGDTSALAELESGAPLSFEALLAAAEHAERSAAFAVVLERCDVALRRANFNPSRQALTYDMIAPAFAALRAFALAALGRPQEADAALAAMPNAAGYPFGATARLRVKIAQSLVRADRRGALELARQNAHVPLPTRDSLLVDLLEASEHADDAERARLRAALGDPDTAKWVEHFLPGTDPRAAKPRVPDAPHEETVELPDHAEAVEQR